MKRGLRHGHPTRYGDRDVDITTNLKRNMVIIAEQISLKHMTACIQSKHNLFVPNYFLSNSR